MIIKLSSDERLRIKFLVILVVMLHTVSSPVSGEEMLEWGDNPDLVNPEIVRQRNKHSKLMVVFVGEQVDMSCHVLLSSQPVSNISCYGNGRRLMKPENHTVEIQDGYAFIEDTFKIGNISEEMDGTTVSCEYSKGGYAGRIEATFKVFKLEIETPEEVCEGCDGNMKLVFKECNNSSPGNSNIDERIQMKIAEMTAIKPEDITGDSSGYSVNLPIGTVMANQAILNIKHKFIIDGTFTDLLTQCKSKCGSAYWWLWIVIVFIAAMAIVLLTGSYMVDRSYVLEMVFWQDFEKLRWFWRKFVVLAVWLKC